MKKTIQKTTWAAAAVSAALLFGACGAQTAQVSSVETLAAAEAAETVSAEAPDLLDESELNAASEGTDIDETYAVGELGEPADAETEAQLKTSKEKVAEYIAGGSAIRLTSAPGSVTYGNSKASIDASNASQGYVCIKYTGSNPKVKIQIIKNTTYTYDVKASGSYEVFPLTEGNGNYSIKVYENEGGTSYSTAFGQDISVSLSDSFGPFLYPNQYVNFTGSTACVQTAASIAGGGATLDKVKNIYEYVINLMTYDTNKAATVQSGYLPNLDQVVAARKGICFDYAAVMSAMLRSQGIPCKLVVGYTGAAYHAWINVYTTEQGWINNAIFFDGNVWKLMDPTFASSGGQSDAIMKYIGNGANYQAKYCY